MNSATEAMASYRQAVRFQPNSPDALTALGVALAQQGQLPEAIATLRQALRIKPDFTKAHHNLGGSCCQLA